MSLFTTIFERTSRCRLMLALGLLALSFCVGFEALAHNVSDTERG